MIGVERALRSRQQSSDFRGRRQPAFLSSEALHCKPKQAQRAALKGCADRFGAQLPWTRHTTTYQVCPVNASEQRGQQLERITKHALTLSAAAAPVRTNRPGKPRLSASKLLRAPLSDKLREAMCAADSKIMFQLTADSLHRPASAERTLKSHILSAFTNSALSLTVSATLDFLLHHLSADRSIPPTQPPAA